MATLLHEIWHEPSTLSHTGWLPSCCLAGPDGEAHRRSLARGARLIRTFEAGSHFEAMTIYHGLMGETYTTTQAWDHEPYPEEWAARQRGSHGAGRANMPDSSVATLPIRESTMTPPPPPQLDGADVLRYVVSERGGYYDVEGADAPARVMAMAICQYQADALFYYFGCTADWEVVGDFDCESIDEAMALAAQHANGETLAWVSTSPQRR